MLKWECIVCLCIHSFIHIVIFTVHHSQHKLLFFSWLFLSFTLSLMSWTQLQLLIYISILQLQESYDVHWSYRESEERIMVSFFLFFLCCVSLLGFCTTNISWLCLLYNIYVVYSRLESSSCLNLYQSLLYV